MDADTLTPIAIMFPFFPSKQMVMFQSLCKSCEDKMFVNREKRKGITRCEDKKAPFWFNLKGGTKPN